MADNFIHRVENVVGKGEDSGYQHFLLFPTMFSKDIFSGFIRSGNHLVKGKMYMILKLR